MSSQRIPILLAVTMGFLLVFSTVHQVLGQDLNERLEKDLAGKVDEITSEEHLVTWLPTVTAAKEKTRIHRAPILVIGGADWCEPCHLLKKELAAPSVQSELERWVPVYLDVEQEEQAARELNMSSIPALRLLTPDGRVVASLHGVIPAEELASWLSDHYDSAAQTYLGDLTQRGTPSAIAVVRIVREFGKRDAALREAAITRLVPFPEIAAAHVVAKLRDGTLSERLSSLELLSAWKAPVDQIDPWIPESVNESRLAKLNTWLEDQSSGANQANDGLTPVEIVEAERLLRLMVTVDAAAAASMREQLSRMGNGVLPFLKEALLSTDDPVDTERLTAARYRLAATGERVLTWPGGLERMASSDFDEKIQAVDEFAKMATHEDEELLLALFADSSPLVREVAIRTLQRVSGKSANGALAKLLQDPDPNVRAAVLKQLAEEPSSALVTKIAEYVAEETDPDLIVHAIRFLREINNRSAVEALTPLFHHVSWRVRADAVDAVTRLVQKSEVRKQVDVLTIQDAFRERLRDEDGFVVSRAVAGLNILSTNEALDELIETVHRHPDLAAEVINMLVRNSAYRYRLQMHLKDFCTHEDPVVRSAAISGLIFHLESGAEGEAFSALEDEEQAVRISALEALFRFTLQDIQLKLNSTTNLESHNLGSHSEPQTSGFIANALRLLNGSKSKKETSEKDSVAADQSGSAQDEELLRIRNDKALEEWIYNLSVPVHELLNSNSPHERLAAARFLALLGDEDAMKILLKFAEQRHYAEQISNLFPGLLWAEKESLTNELLKVATSQDEIIVIATQLAQGVDLRATQLLWNLLETPTADGHLVNSMHLIFLNEYFSASKYNLNEASASELKVFHDAMKKIVSEGSKWQQLAALQLEVAADPKMAATLAETIFDDNEQSTELRQQALKVLLWSEGRNAARKRSYSLLESEEELFAETALAYLALEKDGVASLSGGVVIYSYNTDDDDYSYEEPKPIVPEAPEELSLEQLEKFTESSNPQVLAQVGYFQTLLGETAYLPALIAVWEGNTQDERYRRLLYRALARVNDPQYFSILEQIYTQIQSQEYSEPSIKEFYWTIRIMTGPEVLQLRKEIRDTHGAETLQ
ncbi:HEAT repeat domain-containing protein [Thalassoglobus sp.]|uniref:HEAT repeat domain-containing protein n=1 Tax=Thalassoglobus sp. TaxID=2795869 RepID=UPI003AA91F05